MKNVIKVAVLVVMTAVSAATLSAQAAGTKQTPPAKTSAPAKDAPKTEKAPCKAGEALKDAKKPFNAKSNPCVAKPVK